MADRGQQARLQTAGERCCCSDKTETGGRRRKNETLTQEQSHPTGEKLTDGARVIKHEELRFVSSQKTARKKKKKHPSVGTVRNEMEEN